MANWTLAFGELRTLTSLAQTNLFTLNFTRITGYVARLTQSRSQTFVVVHQCTGQTVTDCTRLTGVATTPNGDLDVELVRHLHQFQGLTNDHLSNFTPKVIVQCASVN